MIDWLSVAFSSMWILGFSILLAQFSYKRWEKSLEKEGFSAPPRSEKVTDIVTILAYGLIGVGLAGNSNTLWERILWIALTAYFIGSLYRSSKESHL